MLTNQKIESVPAITSEKPVYGQSIDVDRFGGHNGVSQYLSSHRSGNYIKLESAAVMNCWLSCCP
jgi:hypothetical protein